MPRALNDKEAVDLHNVAGEAVGKAQRCAWGVLARGAVT